MKNDAKNKAIHAKMEGKKTVKILGHSVKEGSKKFHRLSQDKKHYDDLSKSER